MQKKLSQLLHPAPEQSFRKPSVVDPQHVMELLVSKLPLTALRSDHLEEVLDPMPLLLHPAEVLVDCKPHPPPPQNEHEVSPALCLLSPHRHLNLLLQDNLQ